MTTNKHIETTVQLNRDFFKSAKAQLALVLVSIKQTPDPKNPRTIQPQPVLKIQQR